MKALYKAEAAPGLALVDRPDPACGPADVVIRVLRTGICGTDLHILRWDDWAAGAVKAPLTPGHEFYGEVVEVGELVHDISVGDRVSGEGHIVCGMCRNCRAGRRQMCIRTKGLGLHRDGAFAEFVVLPGENVWVHHSPVEPAMIRPETPSAMNISIILRVAASSTAPSLVNGVTQAGNTPFQPVRSFAI